MASTATLKELASSIIAQKGIAEPAARKIIEGLPRAELKQLLFYIRLESHRRRVRVTTAEKTRESLRARIKGLYPGEEASFTVDASLGGGMRVEHGDDIVDISVKGLLERTYHQLKERL